MSALDIERTQRFAMLRRIVPRVAAGFLLVAAAWEVPFTIQEAHRLGELAGQDFAFYREVAQRWLDTGAFYLPSQLAGPYQIALMRDVLYPPSSLYLFVPFVWLPAVLWWAIPLGILGYALWRWRPAAWTWPLLTFGLFWPRTQGSLMFGNTDMWMAAAVAGGFLWGWPAALVTLKPTYLPLALAGAPRRLWFEGWAVLAVVSLPLIPLWADYYATLRNSGIPWSYSVANTILPLMPVVAWTGRYRRGRARSTYSAPV